MPSGARMLGVALCLIGVGLFVIAFANGDRTWFSVAGTMSSAGAVVLILDAHRSRSE